MIILLNLNLIINNNNKYNYNNNNNNNQFKNLFKVTNKLHLGKKLLNKKVFKNKKKTKIS